MRLSFNQKVTLNFGAAIVSVALLGALAFATTDELAAPTAAIAHTHAVLERLWQLRVRLADAEIAQRNFLLGQGEGSLQPVNAITASTERVMSALRRLGADDPQLREQISVLAPLTTASIAELKRGVALHRAQGHPAGTAKPTAGAGAEEAMERVRAVIDEIEEGEHFRLEEQTRMQAKAATGASVSMAIAMLLAYIAAGLGFLNVRRYLAERRVVAEKRAELVRRQEEARAAAEEANRAKSDFMRVMSHEFRTPLNAIAGYVQLLDVGVYGSVNEEQRAALHRIEQNEQHLLGIVNDLLDLAKLEGRHVAFKLEDVPVQELAAAVEPLIRPQLDAKRLLLVWPGDDSGVLVLADREKTRQVLLNLLSNACKFSPDGGEIRLDWTATDERVTIRVEDAGCGIPPDDLETIFEPFVQLDSGLTRQASGTGLGLAIARQLARGMGGELSAQSVVGQGSVFALTLPRAGHVAQPAPTPVMKTRH